MTHSNRQLDEARARLTWASNRLAEAHRDITLTRPQFIEVLETFLLAVDAYHMAIRLTNESLHHGGAPDDGDL